MSAAKTRCKEAEHVFVLMTNEHRVSRNIRANWYFEHLNTSVTYKPKRRLCEFTDEVEIVSVVGYNECDTGDQQGDESDERTYFITANTKVTFLARRYRFVFILDLSPSVSSVDIQSNSVLYENIFLTLSRSLRGLCSPAFVPGSKLLFEPEICITILAHTPFYTSEGQQVLAQGWEINSENVELLLSSVHRRLKEVTLSVAEVTASASDPRDTNDADVYIPSLFEDMDARIDLNSSKTMTTPDVSIVNMFRYGLLALQLLPEQSNTGIVMITDGMFGLPNASILEILLTQLRNNTVACSFLQIGSNPYPFSCIGYVPYTEIMKFLSIATFGAYLPHCPKISEKSIEDKEFNLYHRAFLAWSFQRGVYGFKFDEISKPEKEWFTDNPYFYYGRQKEEGLSDVEYSDFERVIFQAKDQQLIRHKQFQNEVCAKFTDLLSCRLREGYTIKEVKFSKGETQITVTLVLPFQYNCNMEYVISAAWTPNHKKSENSELNELTECRYEIMVESNYNFLHDVTCQIKKPIKSPYRNDAVRRYWSTLKSLSDSDKFLVHLNKFAQSAGATVPESIRSKIPLFYLPPNSSYPVLTSKNSQSAFAQYWKQICLLDVNMWQRWMHTHRIKLILQHDTPLPKYLHLPSANGRFMHIQCRQALQEVNTLLNNYSSFVMVENHSYIKLIQNTETDTPESFFIIRVITYLPLPYMVIYLAFVGGFSGAVSQKIVDELKEMLKNCKFRKRNIAKSNQQKLTHNIPVISDEKKVCVDQDWVEVDACFLIRKPVEKILIKYETTPNNYLCSFDKQILYLENKTERSLEQINMLTLSKYLHHRRWVWVAQQGPSSKLAATTMSKILSTLLKVRLKEGFKFAYNSCGIINVVSEIRMEDNCPENTPCIVQYILFPPHNHSVISNDFVDIQGKEETETDGEWQLITECWIEPQVGYGYDVPDSCSRFEKLSFKQIAQSFFDVDSKIISTLLTVEHITLMCNNPSVPAFKPYKRSDVTYQESESLPTNTSPIHDTQKNMLHKEINVSLVPFCFNIVNLFTKCQQAQLTFSTLISDIDFTANGGESKRNISNTIFVDELVAVLARIHDREIYLTAEDNSAFLQFVQQKLKEDIIPYNDSDAFFVPEECPKWRCFAKTVSSKQLILTVIPASFVDLLRLLTRNHSLRPDEIPAKAVRYFDWCDEESDDLNDNVKYCSLTLPIFLYKCGLSILTKQLASNSSEKDDDLFVDYRFNDDDSHKLFVKSLECDHENDGKVSLKHLSKVISDAVWISITKVIFQTLQFGLNVDKRDIDFVLNSLCDKTSIEIDIWPFLRSICGHVKDYCHGMHQLYEERIRNQSSQSQMGKPAVSPSEKNFPLDLLKRHHPCDDLKLLHSTIKKRFVDVLLQYMIPIKCKPSSFVFKSKNLKNIADSNTSNLSISKTLSNSTPNITEVIENPTEIRSNHCRVHRESTSLPCSLSSRSNSICQDEEDVSSCSSSENKQLFFETDLDASPLFLDIQCSVKCNDLQGNCTLESMPTCLGDVTSCLGDSYSNIDISNLTVSLSVICLTLDINADNLFSRQCNSHLSSNTKSNDPIQKNVATKMSEFLPSFITTDTEKDFLLHLPEFQKNIINNFMTKIQWMLQDEIVASYLKTYPISEAILEAVAKHVEKSEISAYCIKEEIPLKFVHNQESSLEKFKAIFCCKELSGFQLKKEGKFYYLVYGEKKTKNTEKMRSSLIPPLNFFTQIESFHCVDSTELKQVCFENEKSFSEELVQNLNGSEETYGSLKSSLTPSSLALKNMRTVRANSRIENELDDSDNSDNSDVVSTASKKRPLRKVSKSREKSLSESRSASVPPSSPIEKNQDQRKPGQSAPADVFNFLSSVRSPKKRNSLDAESANDSNLQNTEAEDYSDINSAFESTPIAKQCFTKRKLKDIFESSNSTPNYSITCKDENKADTEDAGYDPGDSSDSDGELNWQTRDNKQPILPPFWIILKINMDNVLIYFHTRHHLDKSDELDEAMNIWSELKQVICKNCRVVNQTVLLQYLHDSRMCHDLLVRNDEQLRVKHDRCLSFGLSGEFEQNLTLSEATQTYEPGAFECEEVWNIHFPLHPRLFSSGTRTSRGIQAVRSVLNSFSVNNRQNMFVYQETSGNVFYLKLSEVNCVGHSTSQEFFHDSSKSSSVGSLVDKSFMNFASSIAEEYSSFRDRVGSTASENYNTHETMSVASQTSSAMERFTTKGGDTQDCIVLHVYGIGEVGKDIKEEMAEALQKRLDEAVLDVLIVALTRNPHCKLTPKDVFFIQKPRKQPNLTNKYFIRPKLLMYLHPIKVYLRQNLLHFLNNPKYTDNDSQNHFKAFSKISSDLVVEDDDVFLHYRQQASGTSGSKGIACIILSVVDGNDNFVRSISSPSVMVNTHCDLPLLSDFEEEVECKSYEEEEENIKSPGPIAILRFQIWCIGKVDLDQLSGKLKDAVKCAFWDVVTEYRFLMVPLSDWNDVEESGSFSAPISPRKERRLGRILFEEEKIKLLNQLEVIQGKESKEFFSSVPDFRAKNALLSPVKQVDNFNFDESKKEIKSHEIVPTKIFGDYLNLVKIYHTTLRGWMDFGTKFGVPSVSIKEYKLMSRRSVVHFVNELHAYISNLSPTVCIKTYQLIDKISESFREITDLKNCVATEVGVATEYIMIMRNVQLWKAFIGFHDERKSYLESLFSSKSKSNQRLPPHICNFKNSSNDTIGNPLSAVSHTSLSSYSQLDVKSCISVEEQSQAPFVPRQKIFMVLIEDKNIKLYIYNWSHDAIISITSFAESLTEWQNSRTSVLYSFVAQKMGLFHNQPFQRKCQKVKHSTQIQRRDTFSSYPAFDKAKNQKHHSYTIPEYTDLLIENNSHSVLTRKTSAADGRKRRIGDISSLFRECVSADINDSWTTIDDYVLRFGNQGKHLKKDMKDLQYLSRLWHLYGSKPQAQILDKMMRRIQQVGRLQHFCATPLLFTSQWRQKVSLVRDHTLEPVTNDAKLYHFDENRSRHSSGNSGKGIADSTYSNRSRRLSGPPTTSYPVKTIRNSFDESWHFAVCTHYIQEYIQYLQTLGFVAVQLKNYSYFSSKGKSRDETEANEANGNGSFYQKLGSRSGLPTNFLYKSLMGGLLVFEVGVFEPYVYSYLYSLEGKRLQNALMNTKLPINQFICSFLDEIDKVKVTMHLHSFTYDYHLRTIHSYISGRQLIFKQGYHLISFLEDFMKYYQKAPNFARNQIHAGELKIQNLNVTADQLYNYITSHNEVYGMNVFRVVSASSDQEVNQSPEYVLIQLSSQSVPYRDHLDARQLDNFDIALLICQNRNNAETDKNSICLKYFVLLTSQREVYPKLYTNGIESKLGSMRPIRLGTSLPPSRNASRKNSTNVEPSAEIVNSNSFSSQSTKETSLNTSFSSLEPTSKQLTPKTLLNVKTIKSGMCDEDVTYLGYFSSHEQMMLQLLTEKAESASRQLCEIVSKAAIHCRRDHFWKLLNQDNIQLTYSQFNELLSLVYIKDVSEFDRDLNAFSSMQFSFFQNVSKTLITQFGVNNHKQFTSPDGKIVKHVYINKPIDVFMLLTLNSELHMAEARLVFKEEPMVAKTEDQCAFNAQLVKDYLDACSYHRSNQQTKSRKFFFWKKS